MGNLCLQPDITPDTAGMPEGRVADFQTNIRTIREAGYGKFDTIHKADLKISDIGNLLGSDWVKLAHELEIPDSDINIIKTEYPENEGQQAMVMLRFWLNTQGNKATGNGLERALRKCDREDIINKCIFNVELVTDESEKHVAEEALTEKMEKMTFESGADTSLVEAAAIASRELEVEETGKFKFPETGNRNDQTGSALAPSAAAPSSGGQLEPALIHSDDDPSKEDDDKDDEILPTKDDIPRRKQHDADSDSSEE